MPLCCHSAPNGCVQCCSLDRSRVPPGGCWYTLQLVLKSARKKISPSSLMLPRGSFTTVTPQPNEMSDICRGIRLR